MYDAKGSGGLGSQSEKCIEPDWEAEIAKAKKELEIIESFKRALIDFIDVIGIYSLRRKENSSIPELLGTVELDILERTKTIAILMKKLEV